jgi:hypothetical protein
MSKRILVLVYSHTDTTARLARDAGRILRSRGFEAEVRPLVPRVRLPYVAWLVLSCIPGLGVPVREGVDPADYDALVLAFPKWTLSCPPVNGFLRRAGRLPPTAVVISYGGWDEERYLADYLSRIERRRTAVLGGVALRRHAVGAEGTRDKLAECLGEWFRQT